MSHILFENPNSLSYQADIFPIFVPTTLVSDESTIADEELWLKSMDTNFSVRLVNQRRKLLDYLKGKNVEGYRDLIKRLGLRR